MGRVRSRGKGIVRAGGPMLLHGAISARASRLMGACLRTMVRCNANGETRIRKCSVKTGANATRGLPHGSKGCLLSCVKCTPRRGPRIIVCIMVSRTGISTRSGDSLILRLTGGVVSRTFPCLNVAAVRRAKRDRARRDNRDFRSARCSSCSRSCASSCDGRSNSCISRGCGPSLSD